MACRRTATPRLRRWSDCKAREAQLTDALPRSDAAWDGEALRSARFGDLYYSVEDGLAEATHVFVDGNDLRSRFASMQPGDVMTLAETGFGTGLNVAAAIAAFAERGHRRGRLDVWSCEGFPLGREAFTREAERSAARWPGIAAILRRLADAYPEPRPGQMRLRLGPDVTLTLAFAEAGAALAEADFAADAFLLDGFAPRTNPEMWREEVLGALAARGAPGATLATFTVSGAVRRGLEAAGFALARRGGFGRKREMLTGRLPGEPPRHASRPTVVLGAGIAGASAAWHLAGSGREVLVLDPHGPAAGASGNPGGLVTPRLDAQGGPLARFYREAYAYGRLLYTELAPEAVRRVPARLLLPEKRARGVLATGLWSGEVSLAEDGLDAQGALVVEPPKLVAALLANLAIETRRAAPSDFPEADVIVASPTLAADLDLRVPVLTGRRGQIDLFEGPAPAGTVTGHGYAAPLGGKLVAGATYAPARLDELPGPNPADSVENAATAARLLGRPSGEPVSARAAVRAATPDRHPIVGRLSPGLLVVSGLGSRGLLTAPLLGAQLAAETVGGVRALERSAAQSLAPLRFAERAARRSLAARQ